VAFSPGGQRLASASYDGTAKVWDIVSGQETLTLKSTPREHFECDILAITRVSAFIDGAGLPFCEDGADVIA
jgi:WD40 repeat protein